MVTRLGEIPLILAATTKDFAPKTYAEFIAYAKANPGKVRYASVGVGSNNHYDTEAFAQWAGIKLHAHPEQGRRRRRSPTIVCAATFMSSWSTPQAPPACARAGKLRVLAVMADERLPEYPDAPTLKELGYANGKGLWSALYAPAKTPRDVLETMHKATVQALTPAPVQEAFKKQMIKADAGCLDRGGGRLEQGGDGPLEEAHRDGEGRAAGVDAAFGPHPEEHAKPGLEQGIGTPSSFETRRFGRSSG